MDRSIAGIIFLATTAPFDGQVQCAGGEREGDEADLLVALDGRSSSAWDVAADQDGPAVAAGKRDVVAAVTSGAAGLMRGEQRGAFEHYLSSGGQAKLEKAIPIWAASSGMSAADFRGTLVGGGLGDEGALALQAMGRSLAGSSAGPDVAGASGQLAAAVTNASGAGWRYGLSFAGSQAIYAEANGLVPVSPVGKNQSVEVNPVSLVPSALSAGSAWPGRTPSEQIQKVEVRTPVSGVLS